MGLPSSYFGTEVDDLIPSGSENYSPLLLRWIKSYLNATWPSISSTLIWIIELKSLMKAQDGGAGIFLGTLDHIDQSEGS